MWGEWYKNFSYPSIFILFFKIKNKKDSVWQLCSLWIILAQESNWGFLVARLIKNLPSIQGTQIQSLGQEDPLEKGMTIHSSILARRITWTEEPGGLLSMGCKESDMTEWLTLSLSSKTATKIFRKLPKLIYMTTFLTAVSKNVYDEISLLWSLITCHISGWKADVSWTICCRVGHNWVTDTFHFSSHINKRRNSKTYNLHYQLF